jgi:hypothetical protein
MLAARPEGLAEEPPTVLGSTEVVWVLDVDPEPDAHWCSIRKTSKF